MSATRMRTPEQILAVVHTRPGRPYDETVANEDVRRLMATFQRTLGGRMFGYGTIVVESAGQIQALNRIDYLPDPEEVYEAISELVFGDKRQTRSYTLPGSGFGGARARRR